MSPSRRDGSIKLLLLVALWSCAAFSQQPPDAGRLLQEHKTPPGQLPRKSDAPLIEAPIRPALKAPADFKFKVAGFRFSGSSVFPDADLKALLQDFVGREVSLADLEQATDRVTRYYRDRGYFVARAYIPAQEIKDGVVEILILEGKLGQIEIRPDPSLRLRSSILSEHVEAAVPPGQVLQQDKIERALLLLNDLPGLDARSTLLPGTEQATTNIQIDAKEGPLLSGTLEYDNYGNEFTGVHRPGASLSVNDPTGIGDQARFRYSGLSDSRYYYAAYTAPVGPDGLSLGAAYTYDNYHLCCDFAPLNATGRAEVETIIASYPFIRGRNTNLGGSLSFDNKSFYNATLTGPTSDRRSQVLTASLAYSSRDTGFGGGVNSASIALAHGYLNLDRVQQDRVEDDSTARTHGQFSKMALSGTRLQALRQDWTLYANLYAQAASKNLDSSEKFALGGPYGVRSYPQNEAAGDQGVIANLELRYDINPQIQVFAFSDYGHVTLHRQTWDGWQASNTTLPNSYSLYSAGLGASWSKPGDFSVRAVIAQRLGSNPGRDVNGNDSDGKQDNTRGWLQAVKFF